MPYESVHTTFGESYSVNERSMVFRGREPSGGHYIGKLKGHLDNAQSISGYVNDHGEIEIKGQTTVGEILGRADKDLSHIPYGSHLVVRKNKRKLIVTPPIKRGREIGSRGLNLTRLLQEAQVGNLEAALV